MLFSCKRVAALSGILALAACGGVSTVPSSSTASSGTGERVIQVGARVVRYGGSAAHRLQKPGWLAANAANQALLYAASYDGGFVNIYPAAGNNQQVIGQLTSGLTSPQGLAVDSQHNLWVANTNAFNIVGFKHGSTTPFQTLNDPGYYPVGVAVDSHDNVYAVNVQSTTGTAGNITEWKAGSVNPSRTLTWGGFNIVLGIGIDSHNAVYVTFVPKTGPPKMVKFPAGSNKAQPINIQQANIGDITFDTSKNLVMEDATNNLGVWAPPYTGAPVRSVPAFGNEPTFNASESKVCVAYANATTPDVVCYNYTTGKLVDTITAGWTSSAIPYGIAMDPPAPL